MEAVHEEEFRIGIWFRTVGHVFQCRREIKNLREKLRKALIWIEDEKLQ